jgi:hypothetical protein
VFNASMTKRLLLALAGALSALTAAVTLPGAASAQEVQLGQTTTPLVAPSCPSGTAASQCTIILTRTTAVQTVSDSVINPTRVNQPGWIVSFTVGLSRLSSKPATEKSYLKKLDESYGGTPQLQLTVLKPGPKNTYTVQAQSGVYHVTPFLGQVLQEPLSLPNTFQTFTALPVKRGDVIALSVPTWAPVLTYDLASADFGYRQSRSSDCKNSASTETAQSHVGQSTAYRCGYTGTRVEYSATEITNTPYPKTYVH